MKENYLNPMEVQEAIKRKFPKHTSVITLVYNIWTKVAVVKTVTEDCNDNQYFSFVMVWNHEGISMVKEIANKKNSLCCVKDADVDFINNFGTVICEDESQYIASIAV